MSNEKWATPKGDKPTINLPGTIKNNYISKQRVREAINKLEEIHDCPLEAGCCNLRTINELRRELGVGRVNADEEKILKDALINISFGKEEKDDFISKQRVRDAINELTKWSMMQDRVTPIDAELKLLELLELGVDDK